MGEQNNKNTLSWKGVRKRLRYLEEALIKMKVAAREAPKDMLDGLKFLVAGQAYLTRLIYATNFGFTERQLAPYVKVFNKICDEYYKKIFRN